MCCTPRITLFFRLAANFFWLVVVFVQGVTLRFTNGCLPSGQHKRVELIWPFQGAKARVGPGPLQVRVAEPGSRCLVSAILGARGREMGA